MTIPTHRYGKRRWAPICAALLACQPTAVYAEWGISAASGVDCYAIERATIIDKGKAELDFGLANVGHQVAAGTNVVLSVRAYEDSGGGPDSQLFEKATLELRELPGSLAAGQTQSVPVIRSYFSAGQQGFVEMGNFVRVTNRFRTVEFSQDGGGLRARLQATFLVNSPLTGEPQRKSVAWTCPVIRRKVEQLTAWEGRPGTSYNSFYPSVPPPSYHQAR